ncbi:hypothetical protein AO953_33495 [Pseudomonas aeruginosa]|nr:hypothetical protein AO953_33495 [Pseudomonas aeruginosa]
MGQFSVGRTASTGSVFGQRQQYENAAKPVMARVFSLSNLPNYKSLTFSRSAPFRWTTAKRHSEQRFAGQVNPGFPAWEAAS